MRIVAFDLLFEAACVLQGKLFCSSLFAAAHSGCAAGLMNVELV